MSVSDALAQYDVPRSTYYRWKRNLKIMGTRGLSINNRCRKELFRDLLQRGGPQAAIVMIVSQCKR
jgi:ACT domain-containing protein